MTETPAPDDENNVEGSTFFDAPEDAAVPPADGATPDPLETVPEMGLTELQASRRAMQKLIARGVIYESRHEADYRVLVNDAEQVSGVLEELSLRMSIDREVGVILLRLPDDYLEGEEEGEEGSHPLVRRRRMTLFDSLTAVVLRKHYRERELTGEQRVRIDIEQLEQGLVPFLPLMGSEEIFRKHLRGVVDRFKDLNLLLSVRGSKTEFEIAPVIRVVVNAEWIESLVKEFQRLSDSRRDDATGEPVAEEQGNE